MLEALTGGACETKNKYKIFACDETGKKLYSDAIFKTKEESGFCNRLCCPADCRAHTCKIKQNIDG